MGNCIDCLIDLCDVIVCDSKGTVSIPAIADISGSYRIVLEYQNTAKVYDVSFSIGEKIEFELDCLNENYCYEGYIVKPDATVLPIYGTSTYMGFKFCTKQGQVCKN
jgi:hypothetical protein